MRHRQKLPNLLPGILPGKGNRLLLFTSDWAVRWAETHNETLELSEFGNI